AFAIAARVFAASEGLLPDDPRLQRLERTIRLEHGLIAGALLCVVGCGLILVIANVWRRSGFGPLDYAHTMRWVIPGTLLVALGFQRFLSASLLGLLRMRRR